MQKCWGWHLLMDAKAGNISKITNKKHVKNFAKEMVQRIDMKAYGKPQVLYFAGDDPIKAGFSLLQLIETSLISGHFVDQSGDFYVDIFSCKEYDPQIAIDTVKEYFDPVSYTIHFIHRGV